MTLHQTVEIAKKFLLGIAAGIGVIFFFFLLFQLGVIIKNILFPPQILPANHSYGTLPAIQFPENSTSQPLTYTVNTLTGTLPEFPDRLNVFPIQQPQPNFLNLDRAKEKAAALGFITEDGRVSPEIHLGSGSYRWTQNKNLSKELTMNIITFDFILNSNYLTALTGNETNRLPSEFDAVEKVKTLLNSMGLNTADIVYEKTTNPDKNIFYSTKPQFFSIQNNILVPATSISQAQVIRVDLYQQNMTYALNTGITEVSGGIRKLDIDLPILYPRPPHSTMSFWIAPNDFGSEIVAANFTHQTINKPENTDATYSIKTSEEAFEELKNGKAYIASYAGSERNVAINNVYLAYYLGEKPQQYLMPIIVFEGSNGFFAYISAVKDEWTK